jgi:hypothetical protein
MHHVSWLVSLRCRGASVTRLHALGFASHGRTTTWPARRWVSMTHEQGDAVTYQPGETSVSCVLGQAFPGELLDTLHANVSFI